MTAVNAMPASPPARPLRFAMLIPTLLIDVAAPIAILKGLEALGVSPVWALAAGSVPPFAKNLHTWARSRRIDPAGILIVASMASGVAASIISGNLGSSILTGCVIGSAWGFGFLGSLLLSRPALFYLIRPLVAGEDSARIEAWNGLWRYAAFRATLRRLTAAAGLIYFAGILTQLGLVRVLALDTVVAIGPTLNLGMTVVLIVFIRWRMRAMRARLVRQEGLAWPL